VCRHFDPLLLRLKSIPFADGIRTASICPLVSVVTPEVFGSRTLRASQAAASWQASSGGSERRIRFRGFPGHDGLPDRFERPGEASGRPHPTHARSPKPPGVSPPMFSGRQTVLMGWQASTDSDRLGEGLRTTAGCSTVEGSPIRLQPSPQQVTGNRPPHGLEPLETALASSGGGKRSPKQVQEAGAVAGTPRVLSLWRTSHLPRTQVCQIGAACQRKVGPRRFTWRQAVSSEWEASTSGEGPGTVLPWP
jgi:hypothetical protein